MSVNKMCIICGSTTTSIDSRGYLRWYGGKGVHTCHTCYKKEYDRKTGYMRTYYTTHKPYWQQYGQRRIDFQGSKILLESKPRKGQCMMCGITTDGDINRTVIHHDDGYHKEDVLHGTIELCLSCHSKRHAELRRKKGSVYT